MQQIAKWLVVLIFFNNIIGRCIPTVLLDELVFAFVTLIGVCSVMRSGSIYKKSMKIILLTGIVVLLGLVSSYKYGYQTEFLPILKDIVAVIKLPVTFAFSIYAFAGVDSRTLYRDIIKIVKVSTVIIFMFGPINLFLDIGMDCGFRNGFRTYQFLFSHPTFLVYTLVLFVCLLFLEKEVSVYIVLNIITMILTFRDKAYFFIIMYAAVVTYRHIKGMGSKAIFFIAGGMLAAVVVYFLSFEKLSTLYLVWGNRTARGALYLYGLEHAIECFPLGTGFATWGTSAAGEYYSVLYSLHNMEYIPGIMPTNLAYATDTFWPSIYTQYGFIGLIFYVWILVKIFWKTIKENIGCDNFFYASFLVGVYAVIASLFEGFFTNDSGVFTIIILTVLMKRERYENPDLLQ